MSILRTAAKTVLATLLALLIALRLDLPSPRTAMFCVLLVMQARSGLVLQKSWYRLLGTAVGALMAVVLVSAFAQAPLAFMIAFGAWMAVCTAGAFAFRNFQSYGFVLAGYTVSFVALPVVDMPLQVVDAALTRMVEMSIGVLCAALVSDLVFPERVADLVAETLQRRYRDLRATLAAGASWLHDADQGREHLFRFVGDALGLDAAHANAALESSALRRQRQRLRLLNHQYMSLTSTLHALHQMLRRARSGHPATGAALEHLYGGLCAVFQGGRATAPATATAPGAPATLAAPIAPAELVVQLARWQDHFAAQLASQRMAATSADSRLDFDSAVVLIERLADEEGAYCRTQAHFDSGALPEADIGPAPLRFATRTDPLLAAVAALRGIAVLLLTGSFWLLSGWAGGVGPVLNGVASSTVFAGAPDPARLMRQAAIGALITFPLGLLWNFQVLPLADGWLTLCLLLAPPLLLIAVLLATPALTGIGAGMMISFMLHLAVDRGGLSVRPMDYADGALADVIGFLAAWLAYTVINPQRGGWGRRRTVAALRRQLVEICSGSGRMPREHLESASRDLVQSLTTRGRLTDPADRWVIDWMFTVLEVGRAAIDARDVMRGCAAGALPAAVPRAVTALGALFASPSPLRHAKASAAVRRALRALVATPREGADWLPERSRQLLVHDLYRIRGVLLDPAAFPRALTHLAGGGA